MGKSFLVNNMDSTNGKVVDVGDKLVVDTSAATISLAAKREKEKIEKAEQEKKYINEYYQHWLKQDHGIGYEDVIPRKDQLLIRLFYVRMPKDTTLILSLEDEVDMYGLRTFAFGKVLKAGTGVSDEFEAGDLVDVRQDLTREIVNEDWVKLQKATKDSAFEGSSYEPPRMLSILADWRVSYGYDKDRLGFDKTDDDYFTFLIPAAFVKATRKVMVSE